MDSKRLCEILRDKYSVTVTPAELLDLHIGKGLIPMLDPECGFSDLSPAMFVASKFFIEKQGWSADRVAHAVSLVGYQMAQGDALSSSLSALAKSFKPDAPPDRRRYWANRAHDAFRWGVAAIKVYKGFPVERPATITERPKADGEPHGPLFWVEYTIEPGIDTGGGHLMDTIVLPGHVELRDGGIWLNF